MVICICKESKLLQTVSIVMKFGCQEVQRRNGQNVFHVRCPNDIVEYQKNVDGVDIGDQHRTDGSGLSNVDH